VTWYTPPDNSNLKGLAMGLIIGARMR